MFISKVLEFTDNWIRLEGKGIVVFIGLVKPLILTLKRGNS